MRAGPGWGVAGVTGLALLAFAANSLLCRMALGGGLIGPWGFTGVRLLAGAAVLGVLLRGRGVPGSWAGAGALAAYAVGFSLAYVRLPAGVGALTLFAAVQATMLGWGAVRGAAPSGRALAGMALAAAGLVGLLAPGVEGSVDGGAAALMVAAGVAWGAYSLLGRGVADAAGTTAGNFVRLAPVAAVMVVGGWFEGWAWPGVGLAALSGSVASGLGYVAWYRVLPRLSVTQAGAMQLAVPVVAAIGGVVVLGEVATGRMVVAGVVTLVGVGVMGRR